MRKETGRWKDRWKIRDLLADERCSRAVLDFFASTDVGRRVPVEGDSEQDVLSFVITLVRTTSPRDRPGRRAGGNCNVPPPRGLRTGDGLYIISP